MRIDVVTLFPELFGSVLSSGLLGKALEDRRAVIDFVDPRSFTHDKHRTVDDAPYGGGAGMVMKPEPLVEAIEAAQSRGEGGTVVLLTPQGRRLEQQDLARWSKNSHLVLVAGRYEGFDERVRSFVHEEISIGDFVLTGGEYAALVIIDGVVRLLPGTLGNEASVQGDSFSAGLLEHAQYTRPREFRGQEVPELLRSGDHASVERARRQEALARTRLRRPDLLEELGLDAADRGALIAAPSALPKLAVVLDHHEQPLTPGALELCARAVAAYDVAALCIASPEPDVLAASLAGLAVHVPPPAVLPRGERPSHKALRRRAAAETLRAEAWARAVGRIRPVASAAEAITALRTALGPAVVAGASASGSAAAVGPRALVRRAQEAQQAVVLVLGEAASSGAVEVQLPALRAGSTLNRLGAAGALVAYLDRLIGEG